MTDPLLDDVKALLDKDFGDDRILKQICRACENDEVISNYERNYVEKLAEKHLGRKPEAIPAPVEEPSTVPDVVIPETQTVQNIQTLQSVTSNVRSSKIKNPKVILGIILVVIVASAVGYAGATDLFSFTPTISDTLYVQIDSSSYAQKDLISINGESNISGTVTLSISNQSNDLVWTEQVSVKSNGSYSTLAIAGGPGWETSGKYTITAENGEETRSDTFSFTA